VALLLVSEGTSCTLSECALARDALDWDLFRSVLGPVASELKSKLSLIGELGAYISDSGARSEGDVRAENNCRMLSDWIWVVCRDDCRAMRKAVDGEDVPVGPWKLLQVSFRKLYGIPSKIDVKSPLLLTLHYCDGIVHSRVPCVASPDELIERVQRLQG
jgi:hypothetical protein